MSIAHQETTMVSGSPTDTTFDESLERLEAVRRSIGGQVLLSQSRCVDELLDLISLSVEPAVRAELSSFLAEISRLSAVRADRVGEVLNLCLAALDVESAFVHMVL